MIDGATSLTDHAAWRQFCTDAAADLSLLERDPDGLLAATLEGLAFARERYGRVRAMIEGLFPFGSLDGVRVRELGAGYGGQALELMRHHRIADYQVVDLPEPLTLQQEFLASHGYNVWPADGTLVDLFVSSFALSELRRDLQLVELERAAEARYGFIYWNGWLVGAGGVTLGETIDRLPEQVAIERCPDHARNRILTWRPV